ncbi:MAG: ABC transporter permease [Deltaproteobacteria bacterium]|nr:ABC transporter permease [Deltaproteobacteria bacterium]
MHQTLLLRISAILMALLLSAMIFMVLSASPLDAFSLILYGAFGSWAKLAYVMTTWAPVLLCSAGLLITFAAGLWNIGIEGQIVMGAVFATGLMQALQGSLPPSAVLILAGMAGLAGGALWGMLVGGLRRYGNVNEIFGGLGLNFIAGSLTVYLVLGPWKRPGIGSTSGTEPFPPSLWLPSLKEFQASPIEILLGLMAITSVAIALRGTHFGLQLRAIGMNVRAAFLKGISVDRNIFLAFGLCGALAGLAGWILIVGTSARHNLFPLISSGYGYLAILVVLLANLKAFWSVPISFFFAAISMGSLQLPLQRQLDSSLGGVIQGMLVLSILVIHGIRSRWFQREG